MKDAQGYKRPVGPGRHSASVLLFEDVQRLKDDENVKRLGSGELASECWKMFRDGASVVEVVIKLKITPERARNMHEQYKASVGGLTVPNTVLEQMKEMGFSVDAGNFVPTIERLLRAARENRRKAA
ncbi:MAG: hypothetical protein E6Q97_20480 [Desulfurellales bacterium]|nr:MAG: hypothetical protein E6Q97_20480 [Desulfurellales bacterium]